MKIEANKLLRLGIIGLSEGNGHPYSWSAIFNGYDPLKMSQCPFPVIPEYLAQRSFPKDCIQGVKVTHVWTQNKDVAQNIAAAAKIECVVERFEDMIGEVDGILLARDDAENHAEMSIPFLDAGMPVYIDKPIALNTAMLNEILSHEQYPGQVFSCSALRFAKEFNPSPNELAELGAIKYVEAEVVKSWVKYAPHIIDPVLHILNLFGQEATIETLNFEDKRLVFARWSNVVVKFAALGNVSAPIVIRLYGTHAMKEMVFRDTFSAFKTALQAFIEGFKGRYYVITPHELRGMVSLIERGMS